MDIISIVLGFLIGIVAGLVFLLLSLRNRSGLVRQAAEADSRVKSAEGKVEQLQSMLIEKDTVLVNKEQVVSSLREDLSAHKTRLASISSSYKQEKIGFQEKLDLLNDAREKLSAQFKNTANEIFEEKSMKFTRQNKENMQVVLNPFHQQLKDFQKQVEVTYDRETRDRVSLKEQIKQLTELNQKVSEDALNLTSALKGQTKTQGAWGELVLERVLEQSGLQKGREYDTQVRLKNDEKQLYIPDVLVHLPNKKDVIVDSKVSLTSYERYCSAGEDEKAIHLKALNLSIKNHINELSAKVYQNLQGIVSLDFVLMFIPMEGAFSLVLQENSTLFTDAFSKKIILVSPTTLLATLRTIQNSWRYEDQNRNAQEIAKRAGQLYDKFASFTDDLGLIGSRLDITQKAYEEAVKKLSTGRGNLVKRVEDLRRLGAPSTKNISPEISKEDDSAFLDE